MSLSVEAPVAQKRAETPQEATRVTRRNRNEEPLALLLLVAMPLGVSMEQNRTADEEQVRALDDQERIAALKRDIPALERLWSEQLTVNAPNNQVVVGRRATLDTFVHAGVINFSRFDRKIEFIRADGDFVFIMGMETVTPLSDAPSAGLRGRQNYQAALHEYLEEGRTSVAAVCASCQRDFRIGSENHPTP